MSRSLRWAIGDLAPGDRAVLDATSRHLAEAGWDVGDGRVDDGATPAAVLVWTGSELPRSSADVVTAARTGGTPVLLVGPTLTADVPDLREASGLSPDAWAPAHQARLRAAGESWWQQRVSPLGEPLEVHTAVLGVDKTRDNVQVWMTAQLGLTSHPVLTWNPDSRVGALTVHPDASRADDVAVTARLLHLALRRVLAMDPPEIDPLVVGLLGFGAIGAEHARAAEALPGMRLGAVCDRSAERLASARAMFGSVAATEDPAALLADDTLDVIVVSTPPDSHADWAERVMAAGKDVIVEKPFALTVEDADRVLDTAVRTGRRAVVYQNRRFDPDFLTIARAHRLRQPRRGLPPRVVHRRLRAPVQLLALRRVGLRRRAVRLGLAPDRPDPRVAPRTDRARDLRSSTSGSGTTSPTPTTPPCRIRFQDGTEAVFVHSDLAAALKPRWYLLGTEGAVTSTWRQTSVIRRSAVGTLDEDVLAVTDAPPELTLIDPFGSQTAVHQVPPEPHAFHRQFVDAVRYEWPMTVTAEQSRRVVAVMEAARASARAGGALAAVDGEA